LFSLFFKAAPLVLVVRIASPLIVDMFLSFLFSLWASFSSSPPFSSSSSSSVYDIYWYFLDTPPVKILIVPSFWTRTVSPIAMILFDYDFSTSLKVILTWKTMPGSTLRVFEALIDRRSSLNWHPIPNPKLWWTPTFEFFSSMNFLVELYASQMGVPIFRLSMRCYWLSKANM
jgi:hypothetical protein